MRASSPTRMTSTSVFVGAQSTAPRTTSSGAWSPPMASTATRDASRSLARLTLQRRLVHACLSGADPVPRERVTRGSASVTLRLGGRLLPDVHGLAAVVPAAVRAGVVARLGWWQCGHSSSCGTVSAWCGAALALARVRDTPLGDSHVRSPSGVVRVGPRTSRSRRGSGVRSGRWLELLPEAASAASRGSMSSSRWPWPGSAFRSTPQIRHRPRQSGRQRTRWARPARWRRGRLRQVQLVMVVEPQDVRLIVAWTTGRPDSRSMDGRASSSKSTSTGASGHEAAAAGLGQRGRQVAPREDAATGVRQADGAPDGRRDRQVVVDAHARRRSAGTPGGAGRRSQQVGDVIAEHGPGPRGRSGDVPASRRSAARRGGDRVVRARSSSIERPRRMLCSALTHSPSSLTRTLAAYSSAPRRISSASRRPRR